MSFKETVSQEQYLTVYKVSSVASIVFCVLAFLCNLASLHVFSKRRFIMPNATRKYMRGLCASEIVYVFLNLLNELLIHAIGDEHYMSEFYLKAAMFFITPFGTVARKFSFTVTLVVCCERYIAIGYPLLARTFKFIKHPRMFMTVLLLVISSFHSYIYFGYEVKKVNGTTDNEYMIIESTSQRNQPKLYEVLKLSGTVIFSHVVLLACLLVNILLLISLKRWTIIRRSLNATTGQEKEHTVTILGSTLLFIFLSYPTYVNSMIDKYVRDYGMFVSERYLFMSVVKIGLVLEIASNISNFIFYLLVCRMFRREILYMMRCKKPHNVRRNTSRTLASNVSVYM